MQPTVAPPAPSTRLDCPQCSRCRAAVAAGAVAAAAAILVLVTLHDPGLTVDEPLDVRPGKQYVATLLRRGWAFFRPDVVRRTFADNAEHPPLGRWLLGWTDWLLVTGPFDPYGYSVDLARVAPALAFAVLVFVIGWVTARTYGLWAGLASALAVLVTPRLFGHAHFAALDTFMALFFCAALAAWHAAIGSRHPVPAAALAGIVFGLALLTKIHGTLLPLVVIPWSFLYLGRRAVVPVTVWLVVAGAVFVAGWPWLWAVHDWHEGWDRLVAFLATGTQRATIWVWYFGRKYPDRSVPRSYPWVMFVMTVPIGLLGAGGVGAIAALRHWRAERLAVLALAGVLVMLGLFSMPRVPVYDGARLFLMVFPLWMVLAGRGVEAIRRRCLATAAPWCTAIVLAVFIATQAVGVIQFHPFELSYYNLLAGGLRGAVRLGLEPTYWGDAVDGPLLDRLAELAPPGCTVGLCPVLTPLQPALTTTPRLAGRQVRLAAFPPRPGDFLVIYRRPPYLPPEAEAAMDRGERVFVHERQGVWLSAIYRLPRAGRAPAAAGSAGGRDPIGNPWLRPARRLLPTTRRPAGIQ